MHGLQQRERRRYGHKSVWKRRPSILIVSLYKRRIFGKGPFVANKTVHMAIGQMMNELAGRPSSLTVWGV